MSAYKIAKDIADRSVYEMAKDIVDGRYEIGQKVKVTKEKETKFKQEAGYCPEWFVITGIQEENGRLARYATDWALLEPGDIEGLYEDFDSQVEEVVKALTTEKTVLTSDKATEDISVETAGKDATTREKCLKNAMQIVCNDRDKQYGKPENSFPVIAGLWSAYLGVEVSPMDAAMLLGLLKVARIKTGKYKEDNFIDLAGYTACAMEVGLNENEDKRHNK